MIILRRVPAKFLYRVIDKRAGVLATTLPLLSVSISHGVIRRDQITDKEARADDLTNYKICTAGDIVINRMSAYQGALGISLTDGLVSPDYLVLRVNPDIDPRFLSYLFRSTRFVGNMTARLRGIGSTGQGNVRTPRINEEELGRIPVEIPSRAAQRDIADYLDRETSRIEALIAAKRLMTELIEERDRLELSDLVIPEDCKLAHLRYFATVQSGVTVDAGRGTGADAVTRSYLRVANVQAGHLDLAEVAQITLPLPLAARSTLRRNDVLMTEGGDIDKLGRGTVWSGEIEDCLHQNHVFAVRPDPRRLDSWFLALVTQSRHARDYFESTGVRSTNLASTSFSKILDLPIPVVPLEVQRQIVARWKRRSARTIGIRAALTEQIMLLAERRQALITAAVTGQLGILETA